MISSQYNELLASYVARLASEPSHLYAPRFLLKAYACALLIESTLTSWFVLWESGALPSAELYVFYDRNFKAPVSYFTSNLETLAFVNSEPDAVLSRSLLGVVSVFKSERALSNEEMNRVAVRALITSMLLTQAFRPSGSRASGFDVPFEDSSQNVSATFFRQCIAKTGSLTVVPGASCRSLAASVLSL